MVTGFSICCQRKVAVAATVVCARTTPAFVLRTRLRLTSAGGVCLHNLTGGSWANMHVVLLTHRALELLSPRWRLARPLLVVMLGSRVVFEAKPTRMRASFVCDEKLL
jgi:hypothetical protein